MNKAYQTKLRLYLLLTGLFFLPLSCQLRKKEVVTILYNVPADIIKNSILNKYWGNGRTITDSQSCVYFEVDGDISMKKSASGFFREVGEWKFIPDSQPAVQGTLIFEMEADISVDFDSSASQISIKYRGQKLHLVS